MKKKAQRTQARQGDVLLIRVDEIPTGLKKTNKITLANGEVTGHHHTIHNKGVVGFADEENSLAEFIQVKSSATLVHQEHAPVDLSPGKYRSVIQSQYTPEAIQRVAD